MYKSYNEFTGQFQDQQVQTTADNEKAWDTQIRQDFGLAYTDQVEAAMDRQFGRN